MNKQGVRIHSHTLAVHKTTKIVQLISTINHINHPQQKLITNADMYAMYSSHLLQCIWYQSFGY